MLIQYLFIIILRSQTSIPIIEHFQFFGDNKGNMSVCKAFFKQDQATDTSITILKRVNHLKTYGNKV